MQGDTGVTRITSLLEKAFMTCECCQLENTEYRTQTVTTTAQVGDPYLMSVPLQQPSFFLMSAFSRNSLSFAQYWETIL